MWFLPFAMQVTKFLPKHVKHVLQGKQVKHVLPFCRRKICYNKLKQVNKFASKQNLLQQAKTSKYMCICLYVCLYAKFYFTGIIQAFFPTHVCLYAIKKECPHGGGLFSFRIWLVSQGTSSLSRPRKFFLLKNKTLVWTVGLFSHGPTSNLAAQNVFLLKTELSTEVNWRTVWTVNWRTSNRARTNSQTSQIAASIRLSYTNLEWRTDRVLCPNDG